MLDFLPARRFLRKKYRQNFCRQEISSMDGRPRSGLPSEEECCKQSDPEQFGCPSVLRLLDVCGESETPSTLCTPTPSSFVSHCGLGKNLGFRLRSQTKLITQSVALRYQFAKQMLSEAPSVESAKRMKVNVSSFLIW